jgi:hypothetical protein
MATYREVKGYSIKKVDSDPANTKEGQIWYNDATKVIKIVPLLGSWTSGPNINTARIQAEAAGPIANADAAILAGGFTPGNHQMSSSESWDGSSWTNTPSFGTGRRALGCSSQSATAAVFFGGNPTTANTEEWDGSSWSEQNNLSTARQYLAGFGSQTSAVAAGGYTPSTNGGRNLVEEYDGTSWTGGTNFPASIYGGRGNGATGTAGFVIAGDSNPNPTKSYDGSSWSAGGALNTVRGGMGLSGPSTDALAFGGTPPRTAATENYNGSTWSTNPASLATAVDACAGFGSSSNAIRAAGGTPSYIQAIEEFSKVVTTRSVDVS